MHIPFAKALANHHHHPYPLALFADSVYGLFYDGFKQYLENASSPKDSIMLHMPHNKVRLLAVFSRFLESWKVVKFKSEHFQAWKVMKLDMGHGDSWKSHGI